MIRHEGDEWVLYDSEGEEVLGRHDTKEEAKDQEQAIQASKHAYYDAGVKLGFERTLMGGVLGGITGAGTNLFLPEEKREWLQNTLIGAGLGAIGGNLLGRAVDARLPFIQPAKMRPGQVKTLRKGKDFRPKKSYRKPAAKSTDA